MAEAGEDGAIGVLGGIELSAFRDVLHAGVSEVLYEQITGATSVNLLCRELLKRGRRIVVFSLDASIDTEQVLDGEGVRIYLGPFKNSSVLNAFREERRFLVRAMRRENLACLHAHWTYEYALAAVDSGLPHVVTAHDAPLRYLKYKFALPCDQSLRAYRDTARTIGYWSLRTLVAYWATRRSQRLVAVAPYVAEHLRRYGFRSGSIEVVPNGIPNSDLERPRTKEPGPFTFATVLNVWGGLKNGGAAIEAFAKVREILPDARLLMIGEGHAADGPAGKWARERGWDRGIEFMGLRPHSEVMDILANRVDVLVHPALVEAHPMPLIEAMAFGIPVIGGRAAGGVAWTLGEGTCGLLVDVRAPEAIAAAMLELAHDDGLRARLGTASHEDVRRRFRLDQMTDRYERIYAELGAEALSS